MRPVSVGSLSWYLPCSQPLPRVTWANPFVGLRETFTSTWTGASPLSSAAVSIDPGSARWIAACRIKIEGSHANVVQASNA